LFVYQTAAAASKFFRKIYPSQKDTTTNFSSFHKPRNAGYNILAAQTGD